MGQKQSGEPARCPLYPQKRTLIDQVGMSALCQKRTFHSGAALPGVKCAVIASANAGLNDCRKYSAPLFC
jgi:hypothetical protein